MNRLKISITGLGYVGLPLACMFSRCHDTIGFDTDPRRVDELKSGLDSTSEVDKEMMAVAMSEGLSFTTDVNGLRDCTVHIITVPTPVDCQNKPDMTPLLNASAAIGGILKTGDTVIYESTVYPGVTEDVCVPVLENFSGLKYNIDFFVGYSPERVNPGDRRHTVENITKLTSGSNPATADFIDKLYKSVLKGNTFKAASIRVAEAAKILENVQRDVNIALMNEAAVVMAALGVDFLEVIRAASTKWNFIPFKPGLVGGHCISVDPYYLIERAKMVGIRPRVMSEARLVNNSMPAYVTGKVLESMNLRGLRVKQSSVLILGFAFKENCPDTRNTLVADIWQRMRKFTDDIIVLDPLVDAAAVKQKYGITVSSELPADTRYDVVIGCVAHDCFSDLDLSLLTHPESVVYDIKGFMNQKFVTDRLGAPEFGEQGQATT